MSSHYELTGLLRWVMNFRLFQPVFFIVLLLLDFANPGLMHYSTTELLFGVYSFLVYKDENLEQLIGQIGQLRALSFLERNVSKNIVAPYFVDQIAEAI